ncbi:MAG: hypothetical protein JOZ77_06415 [Candidatus Eremiobacteraeota bacterium]|nr:hypothetical protein [Candidatus Eremiobacteraeota bacterium]
MNYVEWLRVRNCLRILLIVLAIFVVIAIALRITVNRYMSSEAWIAHMAMRNGAKETQTVLPDGTKRMIVEDPADSTRIVVDDHGYAGRHVVITEPSNRAHDEHDNVAVGSVHVVESRNGSMKTTVIDTDGSVPMIYYMGLADFVALMVATFLAAPLAREIDGHLDVALTRPCSRVRYALGVMGADVAAILAASVLTIVALYCCQLLFESPRLDFSGINARAVAMGVAVPLAWYAMLCAATTWFARSFGAVLGLSWPIALVIGALTLIQPGNLVALVIHDVAWAISRLDPLTYVSTAMPTSDGTVSYAGADFALRISVEACMFVAYGALAVWRWQRVEA